MPVFLGLDCGGSTCRALAIDEQGETVFQGQSGPANLASTPSKFILANLKRCVEGGPEPDAVCGCFAGMLTPRDRAYAVELLKEMFPDATSDAFPDYVAAHVASGPRCDMTIVAGTGSVVCSTVNGRIMKSGGRGYVLGDFGSAFRYGRAALLHYLDAPPQQVSAALRAAVLKAFRSDEANEIIARLYRARTPAAHLARLIDAFERDLSSGMDYARETLEIESAKLAAQAASHAQRYIGERRRLHVALAGGLWGVSRLFKDSLGEALRRQMPQSEIVLEESGRPPVTGAAQLAKTLHHEH